MILTAIKTYIVTCFLMASLAASADFPHPPEAKQGFLDVSHWNFAENGTIELNGDWEFYWQETIMPGEFDEFKAQYQAVPRSWVDYEWDGETLPYNGYATYRLRIQVSPKQTGYGIYLPYLISAGRIFVNGQLMYEMGTYATYEEGYKSRIATGTFVVTPENQELELVVHVANFHLTQAGIFSPIILGSAEDILTHDRSLFAEKMVVFGVAMIMGLYHFGLYLLRPQNRSPLYFGSFCVCFGLYYFAFGGILYNYFPKANSESWWKFFHIGWYGSILFFTLFTHSLFPRYLSRNFVIISLLLTMPALFVVILADYSQYGRSSFLFIPLNFFQISYILIAGIWAAWKREEGALIFTIGVLILSAATAHDILAANNKVSGDLIAEYGFLAFIFAQSFLLSKVFSQAFFRVEQSEKEIRDLIGQLKEQERLRTMFFQNTSHELRTPLNGMMGFIHLIGEGHYGSLPSKIGAQMEKIANLARSLLGQVNTILDLARSHSGELKLINSQVALNEIIEETLILAEGLVCKNRNQSTFQLTHSWEKDSVPSFIGDREKISAIIRNLVGNAFKFFDRNRINQVRIHFHLDSHRQLRIEVEDSGIGIPESEISNIFREFHQVEAGSRRIFEGTGLGLAMVKNLADLLQGSIKVESKLHHGSRFCVTIPEQTAIHTSISVPANIDQHELSDLASMPASKLQGTQPESLWTSSPFQRLENYRILVIDDNPINCEVVEDILGAHGFPVDIANSGHEGLEKIRNQRPDLVLLDLMMPEFSGEDVLRAIRQEASLKDIPVILLTARASQEDRLIGLSLGADDYLAKPFVVQEMILRVNNILTRLDLAKAQSEQKVLEQTLTQARQIQNGLGMSRESLSGIELASYYQPSESVGGDWFGFHYDPKTQRLYVLIGDVTGHGIPSALITVAAAGAFRGSLCTLSECGDHLGLEEATRIVAHSLNDAVLASGDPIHRHMTMNLCTIDMQTGQGFYLNAGHHACIQRINKQYRYLLKPGTMLGFSRSPNFGVLDFQLSKGDVLFFFTDGLIENSGPNDRHLSHRQLIQCLQAQDATAIKKAILEKGTMIWQTRRPEDDCTFVILKFDGLKVEEGCDQDPPNIENKAS